MTPLTASNSLLDRLFPRQADNRFHGNRAALWLLGLFIALKFAMSVNSMVNTAAVAGRADGFPLESYGPEAMRAVLMLFALLGLGQLALTVIALTTVIRYRALVPLMYLVLIGEQLARRWIVQSYAITRTGNTAVAWYVNLGLIVVLTLGLVLSLLPSPRRHHCET